MEEEQNWKKVQTKTFTKWINAKISIHNSKSGNTKDSDIPPIQYTIDNIFTDLHDGIVLKLLLEILLNEKGVIKLNTPAVTRFQKVENVQNILDYIASKNIKLVNIGSFDIVDGNEKLILGLIWIVILRFSIYKNATGSNDSEIFSNKKLLAWCRAVTASYKNVDIKDFSKSWQDGLAFNSIIHKFRPDLVEYEKLKGEEKIKNLNQAFTVAEDALGIPKLLDAEDLADVLRPDEKSVMTYVSCFYDKFHTLRNEDKKKRIEDFILFNEKNKILEAIINEEGNDLLDLIKEIEDNNNKYHEIKKVIKELYLKNVDLEEKIQYKKLSLNSNLGTVKSINNFYKIRNKNYEVEKILDEKVDNKVNNCDKCSDNLNEDEMKFNHEEKILWDNQINEANEVLSNTNNIESQLLNLEKLNSEITDKQINKMFEEKIDIFNKILIKKDIKKIMYEALEMFKKVTSNNKNEITSVEAKEIFMLLGIYNETEDEPISNPSYNLDEFLAEVNRLYDLTFDITKIKNDYIAFSNDGMAIKMNELTLNQEEQKKYNINEKNIISSEGLFE